MHEKQEVTKKKVKSAERIVTAASELFVKQGYAATSISQIAKRAGVTHSLIFHHYSNKQELWLASKRFFLQQKSIPDYTQLLQQAGQSLEDFLDYYLIKRFEFYKNNPDFIRMMSWQYLDESTEEGLLFHSDSYLKNTVSVIERLQENKQLSATIDPYLVIAYLSNLTSGYFLRNMPRWMGEQRGQQYLVLVYRQAVQLLQVS